MFFTNLSEVSSPLNFILDRNLTLFTINKQMPKHLDKHMYLFQKFIYEPCLFSWKQLSIQN